MPADLPIWTVYDHPADYPDGYVARLWLTDRLTNSVMLSPYLSDIRTVLAEEGLTCLARAEGDDPCIVETWF